jgi:hypothetical protein
VAGAQASAVSDAWWNVLLAFAAFVFGIFVWGRYVHETSRADYARATVEGIEIGYRCQRKGFDLDQCRDDYRRFIGVDLTK